jgi:hypothetical protein
MQAISGEEDTCFLTKKKKNRKKKNRYIIDQKET